MENAALYCTAFIPLPRMMKVSTRPPILTRKLVKHPPLDPKEASRPAQSTFEKRTLIMYEVKVDRIIYSFAVLVFALGMVICWILDLYR
jgi:hypothetical protein